MTRLQKLADEFNPGAAEDLLEQYLQLHKDSVGLHWIYQAIMLMAAGHDEKTVMREYGGYVYERQPWQPMVTAPEIAALTHAKRVGKQRLELAGPRNQK